MGCIADADPSFFGYLAALWCVVRSHILEHYTALAVCMAIGGLIAAYLLRRLFPKVKLDKKTFSRATAIWSVLTFLIGLLLTAVTIAPFTLYTGLAEQTKQLTKTNNDLKNVDKEKVLENLRGFVAEGRHLEGMLAGNPIILDRLMRTKVDVWREQFGLYLASSRYTRYTDYVTDEAKQPKIIYPSGSSTEWRQAYRDVIMTNHHIKEMIHAIAVEDAP